MVVKNLEMFFQNLNVAASNFFLLKYNAFCLQAWYIMYPQTLLIIFLNKIDFGQIKYLFRSVAVYYQISKVYLHKICYYSFWITLCYSRVQKGQNVFRFKPNVTKFDF